MTTATRRSERVRLGVVIVLGLTTVLLLYGAIAGTAAFVALPRGYCIPDQPSDCNRPLDFGPLILAGVCAVGAVAFAAGAVKVARRRREHS